MKKQVSPVVRNGPGPIRQSTNDFEHKSIEDVVGYCTCLALFWGTVQVRHCSRVQHRFRRRIWRSDRDAELEKSRMGYSTDLK